MSLQNDKQVMKAAPIFRIGRVPVVDRTSEILHLCANKKILHLGCADMPYTRQRGDELLHAKLLKITEPNALYGLDVSKEGVQTLREMGFSNIICGTVESAQKQLQSHEFDIILAGEIIEHVDNVGMFLSGLHPLMTQNTELLLTTVNANTFKGFLHSVLQHEKVHPDHNYYFSYRTILQVLEKYSFTCKEIYYYQETRKQGLSRLLDKIAELPTYISPTLADGIIVRAIYNK